MRLILFLIFSVVASVSHLNANELETATECSFNYSVNDVTGSISVFDLNAPHVKVKILDDNWLPVYKCTDDCPTPVLASGLASGTYVINVLYMDDNWDLMCVSNVTVEVNPAACLVDHTIDSNSGVTITGLVATSAKIRIYDASTWETVYDCTGDCGTSVFLNGLGEGFYNLDVTLYDQNGDQFCIYNEFFNLAAGSCIDEDNDGICSSQDCDDNNAALPGTPGNSCDDHNSATVDDVISADGCTCAGVAYVGPCNLSYTTTNDAITISGLSAEHVKIRIYNSSWNLVYSCFDDCESEVQTIALVADEAYQLKVALLDENWNSLCTLQEGFDMIPGQACEDNDNDGYCSDIDCDDNDATWPKVPGTNCDDGNSLTSSDVIQYDGCTCAGEIVDPCEQVVVYASGGELSVSNLPDGYFANIKFLKGFSLFYECLGNCNDPTSVSGMPAGSYVIKVALYDLNWDLVCSFNENVALTGFNMQVQDWGNQQEQIRGDAPQESITDEFSELNIYPNPVNDALTVQLPKMEIEEGGLEIYNQLGQLLHQEAIRQTEPHLVNVDCSDMHAGVYYMVVRSAEGVISRVSFVKR